MVTSSSTCLLTAEILIAKWAFCEVKGNYGDVRKAPVKTGMEYEVRLQVSSGEVKSFTE